MKIKTPHIIVSAIALGVMLLAIGRIYADGCANLQASTDTSISACTSCDRSAQSPNGSQCHYDQAPSHIFTQCNPGTYVNFILFEGLGGSAFVTNNVSITHWTGECHFGVCDGLTPSVDAATPHFVLQTGTCIQGG